MEPVTATLVLFTVFGFVNAASLVWVALQVRNMRADQSKLEALMQMFSQTSMEVARCVERLANEGAPEQQTPATASRRWLLSEACRRIDEGQSAREVAQRLGLNKGEVLLLTQRADIIKSGRGTVSASVPTAALQRSA